ncbi:hypothetical protein VKT23_013066 [Stygiomarasmius scandens]|uniref:Uncharacterized protein n=1 Tax=Marasmiellus scandens TaxID=2682957 RepID=A0ABR1J753_9AGAR
MRSTTPVTRSDLHVYSQTHSELDLDSLADTLANMVILADSLADALANTVVLADSLADALANMVILADSLADALANTVVLADSLADALANTVAEQRSAVVSVPISYAQPSSSYQAYSPIADMVKAKGSWTEAAKLLPPLQPMRGHSKTQIQYLCLKQNQCNSIEGVYDQGQEFFQEYKEDDRDSQKRAQDLLASLRLDKDWDRRVPYKFTGCLAHVEITERANGTIKRISGILDHDESCKTTKLTGDVSVPLHPHVYEIALQQLKDGASITAIQQKNIHMIITNEYRDMDCYYCKPNSNYHYLFQTSDHCTLYHKHAASFGIDICKAPQYNIREAIFYYSVRADKGDKLKVCISTPEMDEAAIKYVHQKQLIFDGTFGVASSCLLLFIAMGVDEDKKGLPVTFFLFSAPTGAKATHANYSSGILSELLGAWQLHLETKHGSFKPACVITDTDTKERAALLKV